MSLSKGTARTRVHVEPDSKARPSYEESPGVHSGPNALLPETTARDERQVGIKQLATKTSAAKKTSTGVSLADVKRKRKESSHGYDAAIKKIDAYQVKQQAQIAISLFGGDDADVNEVRRRYDRLQEQVTAARELADFKREKNKRKHDGFEAFLQTHETDMASLKKLKQTHAVASVKNAAKRTAAKVAKTAGKLASAIIGHDPEGADVDVVG